MKNLKAPFPWFGGKSSVATAVWERLGNVKNYVEPFFGSGAVLLSRPWQITNQTETVNDIDCMVCNAWRAIVADPEKVAYFAHWPVNENDLHARHLWLVRQKEDLRPLVEGDPDYSDARIAGWWLWGISLWIGGEFCSGKGPWTEVRGKMVFRGSNGTSIERGRPHLQNMGVRTKRKRPAISNGCVGVNKGRQELRHLGRGVTSRTSASSIGNLIDWFTDLQDRLRRVRVCCGDWSRICGDTPTILQGTTGVFLDPPYLHRTGRENGLYTHESGDVAEDVLKWAIERGDDQRYRIALCGYEGEHVLPDSWECFAWKTKGGMANIGKGKGRDNADKERIWFSPGCYKTAELALFKEVD